MGVFPGVTWNNTLVHPNASPQPVVAVQAVAVGTVVLVTWAAITPKADCPSFSFPPVEYTGSPGSTPMLQVGGVQDAEILAKPAVWRAVTTPAELTVAISGFEVLQVRGGLLRVMPSVSSATASIVFVLPALMVVKFPAPF